MSSRQLARMGLSVSALGSCPTGETLFVMTSAHFESVVSSRSFLRLDSVLFGLDLAHMGLPPSLQAPAQPDMLMLAPDPLKLGSMMLLQQLACYDPSPFMVEIVRFGFSILVSGAMHLGFPLFLRSHGHSGLAASMPKVSQPGLPTSTHSLACAGFALSVLCRAHLGFPLVLRSMSRSGALLSLSGMGRAEPLLPALDFATPASSISLHSFIRAASSVLIPDTAHLGLLLPSRSSSRLSPSVLLFDYLALDSMLPPQIWSRCSLSLPVYGRARAGLSALATDMASAESSVSVRSFAAVCRSASILNCAHFGPMLSLQSSACFELVLFVFAYGHFASSMLTQAYTRLDSASSVLGVYHIPAGATVDAELTAGSTLSTDTTAGFLGSILLAIGLAQLGPPSPVRSFACLDLALSVIGAGETGLAASIRNHVRPGFRSSSFGKTRTGCRETVPVIDAAHADLSVSPHTFTRPDFAVPAP